MPEPDVSFLVLSPFRKKSLFIISRKTYQPSVHTYIHTHTHTHTEYIHKHSISDGCTQLVLRIHATDGWLVLYIAFLTTLFLPSPSRSPPAPTFNHSHAGPARPRFPTRRASNHTCPDVQYSGMLHLPNLTPCELINTRHLRLKRFSSPSFSRSIFLLPFLRFIANGYHIASAVSSQPGFCYLP